VIFHRAPTAMPRRNPASALRDAILALDAYLSRKGRLMSAERQTVERLRSDSRFGEFWQQIAPHLKGDDDAQRVFATIMIAARKTLEAPSVFEADQYAEGWKPARRHAKALYSFLQRVELNKHQRQGSEFHKKQFQNLKKSLSWLLGIIDLFKMAERKSNPSIFAKTHGLSREFRTSPHTTFMKIIGEAMVEICGKSHRKSVALLAEIVLKTPATIDQVRSPTRPTTRSARGRTKKYRMRKE
jgi:hypothetical protein